MAKSAVGRKSDLEKDVETKMSHKVNKNILADKMRLNKKETAFVTKSKQSCHICRSPHREVINDFIKAKKFSPAAISRWVQDEYNTLISASSIRNHIKIGHMNWEFVGTSRQHITLLKKKKAEEAMTADDQKREMERKKERLVQRVLNNVGSGSEVFEAKDILKRTISKMVLRADRLSNNEQMQLSSSPKTLLKANPELTKTLKEIVSACEVFNKMEGEFTQSSLHNEGLVLASFLKLAKKFPKDMRLQVITTLGYNPMEGLDSRDDMHYLDEDAKSPHEDLTSPVIDISPEPISQPPDNSGIKEPDE